MSNESLHQRLLDTAERSGACVGNGPLISQAAHDDIHRQSSELMIEAAAALESTPAQEVPEDDDGLPVGYADWYNKRYAGQHVDTSRDYTCEDAWRAATQYTLSARTAPAEGDSPARFFASGPEGCFFTDSEKFARALTRKSNYPDDWTVTDTGEAATTAPVVGDDRDAERYRWLKAGGYEHADDGQPYIVVHQQDSYGNWHNAVIEDGEVDAAIDAAMGIDTARPAKAEPEYDRELIAEMLEWLHGRQPSHYSLDSLAEQIRLLRAADNATGTARTVKAEGDATPEESSVVAGSLDGRSEA